MPFKSDKQRKYVMAKIRAELAPLFPGAAKGRLILFHGTIPQVARRITKREGLLSGRDVHGYNGLPGTYLTPDPRAALEFARGWKHSGMGPARGSLLAVAVKPEDVRAATTKVMKRKAGFMSGYDGFGRIQRALGWQTPGVDLTMKLRGRPMREFVHPGGIELFDIVQVKGALRKRLLRHVPKSPEIDPDWLTDRELHAFWYQNRKR
jgi:hypothetical protein